MPIFNQTPLHKRTHFRRFRKMATRIMNYEGVDLSSYNLFNIRCYTIHGKDLKGRNVKFDREKNASFILNDAIYDVYEIPNVHNQNGSAFGNYIFIMHCLDWKYWFVGELNTSRTSV